jgi:uncharacterized protein
VHDGRDGKGTSAPPLIDYPLDYAFKVMGLAAEDFPAHARGLVTAALGAAAAAQVSVRASSGGKYQSVTVVVRLVSEDERRRVYQALHDDARVVYYL